MSHDKNQRARPNFSKFLVKNTKVLILFASRNSWRRVSCVLRIFLCEEFVTIMCTVRDPSKIFCQFKHSLMILIRPSESFTLRWDSMKQLRSQKNMGRLNAVKLPCLYLCLYHSAESVAFFRAKKIRFKKQKMYYWRYYL